MQAHILHDKCVLFWQVNMELPVKRPSAGMYFKVIILFAHTRISNKHFILSNFECSGKGAVPNAAVEHLPFKSFHRNYAVRFYVFFHFICIVAYILFSKLMRLIFFCHIK